MILFTVTGAISPVIANVYTNGGVYTDGCYNAFSKNEGIEPQRWNYYRGRMAVNPIYDKKNFKTLLLKNQKANDLETWYVTFGMWGLPSLFK